MTNPQTQNSLISAITEQPLLLAQGSETLFSAYLQELATDSGFMECYETSRGMTAQDDDGFWDVDDPWVASYRPYTVIDGVLQIPVFGVLLHRFSFQFGRRATGYTYIEKAFQRGLEDPEVKAIALVIDSPGGEVAGNFELVEKLVAGRSEKPIRAFASDHAYSAGYSIATAGSQIVMTRSGGVGSVGVVVAHAEMSEMLKDWGIKITFIFAGKHKVEGNQYEKLSDDAKARIQAKVDRTYGEFTALVAANRGMEESAVRDTEALTYDSSEAIEVGFADRIGALETEMAVFTEEADAQESEFMATPKTPNTPAASTDSQITQEQMDAAVVTATSEGASAEKTRINAILDSDEGKARPKAALSAALKTSMSTEEAVAFLGGLPEEKASEEPTPAAETPTPAAPAAAQPTGFNAAMENSGNPEVGAQPEGTPEATETVTSEQMLGALSTALGKPRKQAA